MRTAIAWLVDHAVTVLLAVATVALFGLLAYITLPRESSPDITIPVVLISTVYPGVAPSDVEELITTPLETELASLRDVKKMSSSSAEGFSLISIEFNPDVDVDGALQKVRDRVARGKTRLPDDVEEPAIREISFSDFPVLLVTIAGDDEATLVALAETLADDVRRVDGVLEAKISGGVDREIRVQVDPLRLAHYGLSLSDVASAIDSENVNIPGGNVDVGRGDFLLRVPGTFDDPRQIDQVALKRVGDRPVFVSDVATVIDGQADRATYSRMNGRPAVTMSVTKRAGSNILEVADAVKVSTAEHAADWPDGVSYRVLADQSERIGDSVSELQNNIITALILVVAVIVVFMGLRNSLFVALAIPLSMLMSFLVLQTLGYTLNMVVLFALMLALGMLVDNGIVVVENVYRHLETGKSARDAAIDGTSEVAIAVAASTATTVAAFLPLVFWTGIMGKFMGFMPKTVVIVLTSSLIVAIAVLPVVMRYGLARPSANAREVELRDAELGWAMGAYRWVLRSSIRWHWLSAAAGVASLLFTFAVFAVFNHGTEFFPETDPERAIVGVVLPEGADLDATDQVARAAELLVAQEPELSSWVTQVGVAASGNALSGATSAPNQARITVDFKKDRNSAAPGEPVRSGSTQAAVDRIRAAVATIPGARITVEPEQMGPPVGKPIAVEVSGDDFDAVGAVAQDLRRRLADVPGVTDLDDDYRVGRPELRLRVDRGAAKRVGVSTGAVGTAVRSAIAGTKATTMRLGDDDIDVMVEIAPEYREDAQSVLALRLPGREDKSPDTFPVPLSAVAGWELAGGSGSIKHQDQDLVVTIGGDVAVGYNENAVRAAVGEVLADWQAPDGIHLRLGGANDEQAESQAFLGRAFLIAVALIAMVLVTQFDSVTTPLIILATVVLSLIGVLWGLLLTGTPFGVIMTGLGVISLAGVVVNNAIVLLDYVAQLRERGLDVEDALVEAGLTRFRPVMLTAITTVLGLIPMAVGVSFDFARFKVLIGGASAQWWGPMAIAVIFGLSFATVLTLVMVPTLYSLVEQVRGWVTPRRAAAAVASGAAALLVLLLPIRADAVTLEQSWDAAEDRALQLASAREQQIQTSTLRGKAWSALSPQVDARMSYILNSREVSLDFTEGLDPALVQAFGLDSGPIVVQERDFWQGEAGVSQRLFSGAALPGLKSAVLLNQAAIRDVSQTRTTVRMQVAQAFYGLATARESVTIAEASLASAEHRQELANRQVDAGIAAPRAATQARLDVARARRELESARQRLVDAEEGFATLTGLRGVTLEPPATQPAPESVEAALEQARIGRSDLAASQLRTKAASWERTARDLRWLPVVDGRFAVLYDQNTGFADTPWSWRATVTGSWVLWDGGLRLAEHRETASRIRSAEIAEEAAWRAAEHEIRVAFEGLRTAEAALAASDEEVALAEENLTLAQRSFEAGGATWLDVEQAELARLGAVLARLSASQQRELAALRLTAATGAL